MEEVDGGEKDAEQVRAKRMPSVVFIGRALCSAAHRLQECPHLLSRYVCTCLHVLVE